MNTSSKLAILLFALCAVVSLAWLGLKPFFKRAEEEQRQRDIDAIESSTTEAKVKSTLRIAGDGYLGYFFASSLQTQKESLRQGLAVEWTDDGGAIADRVKKLKSGKYDIITIPAAEYLIHGRDADFPGVITLAIARSNGGDGILARKDALPTGNVSDLNNASLKWVFTSASPSEFLVDITVKDLDFFNLRSPDDRSWRVPTASSEEVFKRSMNGQGDVFVMWEPDISRALKQNPNLTYVWGSDKFSGYIIDYFVVNKRVLAKRTGDVHRYFKSYFRAIDHYRRNPSQRSDDMARWADLDKKTVDAIVNDQKIEWFDLSDNCVQQFGIGDSNNLIPVREGVIDTILSCSDVLSDTGRIGSNDIRDPYRLINKSVLEALKNSSPRSLGQTNVASLDFPPLSDERWKRLKQVASLQVRPIRFRNSTELEVGGGEEIDKMAKLLAVNYPDYRILIRGHTGGNDSEENRELSLLRAEMVLKRLVLVHGFDEDRLKAEGVGSSSPPALRPGENPRSRAYRGRVPRVEAILLERGGI